ncbi:hypothetical protein HEMA109418_09340 [Helcobacillus massiliensis]
MDAVLTAGDDEVAVPGGVVAHEHQSGEILLQLRLSDPEVRRHVLNSGTGIALGVLRLGGEPRRLGGAGGEAALLGQCPFRQRPDLRGSEVGLALVQRVHEGHHGADVLDRRRPARRQVHPGCGGEDGAAQLRRADHPGDGGLVSGRVEAVAQGERLERLHFEEDRDRCVVTAGACEHLLQSDRRGARLIRGPPELRCAGDAGQAEQARCSADEVEPVHVGGRACGADQPRFDDAALRGRGPGSPVGELSGAALQHCLQQGGGGGGGAQIGAAEEGCGGLNAVGQQLRADP